ncbi:MAG: ROK family protein [Chloroflexi bacterium]|nr:ROK family protein [Chloroflexota bacterium]
MSGAGMLAVDLGGTRLRVAVFDGGGALQHKAVIPTPSDTPEALAAAMKDALAQRGDLDVSGVVVGVPGVVSYAQGKPVRMPNLPAWERLLSAQSLAETVGLPVQLANDADLAALGEHRYGAGRGTLDMVYVTSSTGVGGGVIIGGRLLRGQHSLAEVGHMVIERSTGGTVEELGSGTALAQAAGVDGATVAARAEAGDERALAIFRDVADALATGVYNLVHCFSPERVVIGGGVARAGDLLLEPIRERLRRGRDLTATSPDVVLAQGGDDVGLLGAFAFWSDARQDSVD